MKLLKELVFALLSLYAVHCTKGHDHIVEEITYYQGPSYYGGPVIQPYLVSYPSYYYGGGYYGGNSGGGGSSSAAGGGSSASAAS